MAGLGNTALGITPFGTGTPEGTDGPPDTKPTATRYINFRTRDYEVADNGEIKRMPAIRHRVLMALSTTKGSSSVLSEFGVRFPGKIDNRYAQKAEQAIRLALSPMVRARDLRINFVRVERSAITGRVDHLVSYTDLTSLNADTVTV